MNDWHKQKTLAATNALANSPPTPKKYGLTITLQQQPTLNTPTNSEEELTIEQNNCKIKPLHKALNNPLVQQHLYTTTITDKDKINHHQEAHHDTGLAIIIPDNTTATANIQHTIKSKDYTSHNIIIVGKNSTLTITETSNGQTTNKNSATEIIAQKNSVVKYANIQTLNQESNDLHSYRATVEEGATMHWFIASLGSKHTRADVDTTLTGERANSKSYGVFLGTNKEEYDLSASTYHRANNTSSDMHTRGVLDGTSKGIYRGLLDIDKDANDCDGYQTEETILIGERTVADAIPNLQIRNNNVKCSHGASIGRVDEETLFYLQSRGVPRKEAVKMIIQGFFEPLTTKLDWPELFNIIQPHVTTKIL